MTIGNHNHLVNSRGGGERFPSILLKGIPTEKSSRIVVLLWSKYPTLTGFIAVVVCSRVPSTVKTSWTLNSSVR